MPPRARCRISAERAKNDKNNDWYTPRGPHHAYAGQMVQPLRKVTTWIADTRAEISRATDRVIALGFVIAGLLLLCAGALLTLAAQAVK